MRFIFEGLLLGGVLILVDVIMFECTNGKMKNKQKEKNESEKNGISKLTIISTLTYTLLQKSFSPGTVRKSHRTLTVTSYQKDNKKQSSHLRVVLRDKNIMTKKYHYHRSQSNLKHREEERQTSKANSKKTIDILKHPAFALFSVR